MNSSAANLRADGHRLASRRVRYPGATIVGEAHRKVMSSRLPIGVATRYKPGCRWAPTLSCEPELCLAASSAMGVVPVCALTMDCLEQGHPGTRGGTLTIRCRACTMQRAIFSMQRTHEHYSCAGERRFSTPQHRLAQALVRNRPSGMSKRDLVHKKHKTSRFQA